MRPSPLPCPGPVEPVDERDTIFVRARLEPGTDLYRAYYERRPDLQHADDRARALRALASPGSPRFRPLDAALVESCFEASDLVASAVERGDRRPHADGLGPGADEQSCWPDLDLAADPAAAVLSLKAAARFLGAADVGFTALDPGFVYSHRGRPLAEHGEPIDLPHATAIVLVFPMREPWVGSSPEMSATAETARVYQQTAAACFALARTLTWLGADARAHVDSNYLVICPPLAVRAGLGELGRNGLLVHKHLGPGVRLGVVTTDLELPPDEEECHGVADFCRSCSKCAEHCPAGAIPTGEPRALRGAVRWPLAAERCYHFWRSQGSDCGVCVRVCPFAKPDTTLHRFVRSFVRRTTALNRLVLWFDDKLYGHQGRVSPLPSPPVREG